MGVQLQIPFSDGGAYSWLVEHPVAAFAFLLGLRRVFMPVNVVGAHEAGIVRAANKSFEQSRHVRQLGQVPTSRRSFIVIREKVSKRMK